MNVADGSSGVELDRRAVYKTPLGLLCRWMPVEPYAAHRDRFTFVYLAANGVQMYAQRSAFTLTRPNLRILQRVL